MTTITYRPNRKGPHISVLIDGRLAGQIRLSQDAYFWQYFPKGSRSGGNKFYTLMACKRWLEGDAPSAKIVRMKPKTGRPWRMSDIEFMPLHIGASDDGRTEIEDAEGAVICSIKGGIGRAAAIVGAVNTYDDLVAYLIEATELLTNEGYLPEAHKYRKLLRPLGWRPPR